MNILITGGNGFMASYLIDYILENNLGKVYATIRNKNENLENIKYALDKITLLDCDINDFNAVQTSLEESQPDIVFHLAAQTFVQTSWRAPAETLQTNIIGSSNLLEAIRKSKFDPRIQIAGSSEEYGLVKENEVPIKESNPLRPLSPYGVSKVALDLMGYQYYKSYGLKIIRTRCFNTTGPRRGEKFVCSNWSKQIAEIERGLRKPIVFHGNLDNYRDFTDVRDIAQALYLAVSKCKPGEVYNICSEKTWQMRQVLSILAGYSSKKISLKEDVSRFRPSDVRILLGDCSKFKKKTGWQPKIDFKQSLLDLLNYWRKKLNEGKN